MMPDPVKPEFATKTDLLELEMRLTKHIAEIRADVLKEFGNFKTTLVMWNVGLIVALFAALKFIP